MFAQVACGKCGKPFQVPDGQLGRSVACPWCREQTTAPPLVGVVPEALPDDAPPPSVPPIPPIPPIPAPNRADAPRVERSASPVRPPVPPGRLWVKVVVVTFLSLLALVVAFFGSAYYRGAVPGFVWQRFDAPDGTCRVELPGGVTETDLPAIDGYTVTRPGKKYTSGSAFTRLRGFVGWYDLDPAQVKLTRPADVLAAERERRKGETGWEVEAESASAKVAGFEAMEVRYVGGATKWIERYVFVPTGPHPRMYVVGVGGGGFNPDGPHAARALTSFLFDETK